MTVDINHIQVGDSTSRSIEFAMITRDQYNLWYRAYEILESMRAMGIYDDVINVVTANLTAVNCENNKESK